MRRIVSPLLVLVLNLSPTTTLGGADQSHMSFSPPTATPGTEVTVEIQLYRPPVDGTTYGLGLGRAIDDPEAFTATEAISFDAEGYAFFRFTVSDAAPGAYYPAFGCLNASASVDACDDPASPNFGPLLDIALTLTEPAPPRSGARALPDTAVPAP